MFCRKCRKQIDDTSKFCDYCGEKITGNTSYNKTMQSMKQIKPSLDIRLIVMISVIIILGIISCILVVSLYNRSHKEQNSTIQTMTDITTKSVSTTKNITTTIPIQNKVDYSIYLEKLYEVNELIEDAYYPVIYSEYYIYDINHDGIYEMIYKVGESISDTVFLFVSIIDGEAINIGEFPDGSCWLSEKDGSLYYTFARQGSQETSLVTFDGDEISMDIIYEGENLKDYNYIGNELSVYDCSDISALQYLCRNGSPKSVQESQSSTFSTISAHIEASHTKVGDGYEYYLYVDGNFSYVEVSYYENGSAGGSGYTSGSSSPIFLTAGSSFTSVTAYVTPYNSDGIAGDTVFCTGYSD